ncbi:MAG: nucleotide exchange factor GrpE [Flavobacteriales bacterium]|nr:nucleotide exchange factor GrpE [Flavobacteriales bacterium]
MKKSKSKMKSEKIEDQVIDKEQETIDSEINESTEEETEDNKEQEDFKEKFIRLYSEYENYRKRTAKEKIDILTNASENVIKDLLPVIDDFERAIANNDKIEDIEAIKEGFGLIFNKLYKTLTAKGLKPMDSKETEFNIDLHEAITKIPAPKKALKGKVVDVVEKGFLINEKVIRFAKVVVGE